MSEGVFNVELAAPADKGKANIALVKWLYKAPSLPRTSIKVLSRHSNQLKGLTIENIELETLLGRIDNYLDLSGQG